MNYCKLLWCCKTSTLLCLDTYGCFKWWHVSIFSEYQSLVILTPCVALSCFLRHLVLWPKYNVIISKSKTLVEIRIKRLISCRLWFYHSNSIIFLYHYGVKYVVKDIWKTIIWVSTLVHSIMLSPIFPRLWKISNSLSTHIGK
jgi:hypothetical protein